jgi:hypothetical protein
MYYLIKLSQAPDIFICDFMQAIKVCQEEMARKFINGGMAFPNRTSNDKVINITAVRGYSARVERVVWW